MPKRSNEFQALIKSIYAAMSNVEGGSVTESAMLYEPNEKPREVDILIEREMYGHKLKIAIECRDRSRKDDIEWIDGLIGKYKNLKIDRIVAVSKSGFSSPAIDKARENRIDIRTYEKLLETDWPREFYELGFLGIGAGFFEIKFKPERVKYEVYPIAPESITLNLNTEVRNIRGEIIGTVNFILDDYFKRIISPKVKEIINKEFLPSCKTVEDIEREFEITISINIEDLYLYPIDGPVFQLKKLVYIVKGNPSIYDANMEHYKFDNQALVSIGITEFKDMKGIIKIIQVSGSISWEASLKVK